MHQQYHLAQTKHTEIFNMENVRKCVNEITSIMQSRIIELTVTFHKVLRLGFHNGRAIIKCKFAVIILLETVALTESRYV